LFRKTNEKITFQVFNPDYPITYNFVCELFTNGRLDTTFDNISSTTDIVFSWIDKFSRLKRVNDKIEFQGWFIFLYNGRKEICDVAEKVLNKDNPEICRIYKYFLVMY
jgi:hypothetical protein